MNDTEPKRLLSRYRLTYILFFATDILITYISALRALEHVPQYELNIYHVNKH